MARKGPYRIHTTEADGKEFVFNTVAGSAVEAERIFRKLHPRWRRAIQVVGPAFAIEKSKGQK